jgi:hypothetical protein
MHCPSLNGGENLRNESALDEAGGSSSERSGKIRDKSSVRDEHFMRFTLVATRHTRDLREKYWLKGLEFM